MKFKFTFVKRNNVLLLTKYTACDVISWNQVAADFQEIKFHPGIEEHQDVLQEINKCERQRTVVLDISEEYAAEYLGGDFIQDAASVSSEPASEISSVVEKLMSSQQEMMSAMLKTFQDALLTERRGSRKMKVASFDGKSEDARSWIVGYEKACEYNHWSTDRERIFNMKGLLDGTASKWFSARVIEGHNEDWQDWKSSFLSSFGQNRIQSATTALSWEYRGGNLMDFFFEKQRLLNIALPGLNDDNFITLVLKALPEDMQSQLLAIDFKSKEQLRVAMEKLKPIRPKPKFIAEPQSKPKWIKNGTDKNRPEKKSDRKDANVFVVNDDDDDLANKSDFEYLRPPLILLQVNNFTIKAFLDSGSSVNLLSKSSLNKLQLKTRQSTNRLRAFDGRYKTFTEMVDIEIQYKNRQCNAEAVVTDLIGYDLLVGFPTLQKLNVNWRFGINTVNSIQNAAVYNVEDAQRLFPRTTGNLPASPKITVDFDLKPNANVVAEKPYRLSRQRFIWLKEKVSKMVEQNLILHSQSQYASPCVVVPKADGNWRFCQDYRKINDETLQDPYPFPLIDDIVANFGGCRYFTKIDLKDGFWQIGISEHTQKYTAFITPFGHYQHQRLPFGWKNSPAKFQRVMVDILGELLDSNVYVYIDDICCASRTLEENASLTAKILGKLDTYDLKVNYAKSVFNSTSISFLGRLLDGQTKSTRQESVEKVQSMRVPKNIGELRSFTGLTGHFRSFIKDYAKIVRPLDQLKQKNVAFTWTSECQQAFQHLIDKISSNPILSIPDWSLPFELCADASGQAAGAVLYQRDVSLPKNKQLKVIGYYSSVFTPAERNYSITEQEALAVIKALKYFRSYIEGRRFTVYTDHEALVHLLRIKEPKGRLARWQLYLSSHDLILQHRPGKLSEDADSFSRLCAIVCNDTEDGQIVSPRLVTTSAEIKQILFDYHDDPASGGHEGYVRTLLKIKQRFQWQNMRTQIKNYVQSCSKCQQIKFNFRSMKDVPVLVEHSKTPFEVLHIDFAEIEKKKEGTAKTKSFLVVIDECTRIMQAKAMKESSEAVWRYLDTLPFISRTKIIVSDNGKAFTSSTFKQWAKKKNIRLKNSSPYHPASNGMAERAVRKIKTYLKLYAGVERTWKDSLHAATKHLNRSYNESIGCTPYFKFYNKAAKLPADDKHSVSGSLLKENPYSIDQQLNRQAVRINNLKKRSRFVRASIQAGDKILVRIGFGKLARVLGPFAVVKVLLNSNVVKTVVYEENGKEKFAHVSNVQKYYPRLDKS